MTNIIIINAMIFDMASGEPNFTQKICNIKEITWNCVSHPDIYFGQNNKATIKLNLSSFLYCHFH